MADRRAPADTDEWNMYMEQMDGMTIGRMVRIV